MSDFANATYRLEDGTEATYIVSMNSKAITKQYEKDIYDSGLIAGITSEREHIIKLLREHQPENSAASDFIGCDCGNYEDWYTEHLIELIKGETK